MRPKHQLVTVMCMDAEDKNIEKFDYEKMP